MPVGSLMSKAAVSAVLLAALAGAAFGEVAVAGRRGEISAMRYDGEYVDISARLRLPSRGWGAFSGLADARGIRYERSGSSQTWRGNVAVGEGRCLIQQALDESDGAAVLRLTVSAEDDMDVEGVFLFVGVPIAVFSGGRCELSADGRPVAAAELPVTRPENRHFLSGTGTSLRMTNARGEMEFAMTLDRPCVVRVQDTREWHGTTYSPYVELHGGPMRKGQTASLAVTFRLTGEPDRSPARLAVNPARERYRLDGFGGNYCFNIESPVTQYTLDNLRVAWARTEMTPAEWEPENDNASPDQTDWDFLKSHDTPDSNLRRELLLAQQMQERGIPYVISIWHLPEWLYADPGKGRGVHGRRVPPEKWPELLECLGSYLLYAREQYGVEPDLFSFNEPQYGVRVKLTPEEHRDAIKSIGAHFDKLGLRTKMLLADVANPRGTIAYAMPSVQDPEAMRYVGAVAFHSWGGATPEQYAEWGDLARRLGLPLLVTELGVDANWRAVPLDTFRYAMREVRMYQELILYARPQGTMQWEFTSDYSTVDVERQESGGARLAPKKRFWFVKHFCNLTPVPAAVLETESDNPSVLITAFRGLGAGQAAPVYAFHVANFGSERPAALTGLPQGISELRAVRTSEAESFTDLGPVPVRNGAVGLTLAPNSLLTLTTERP